jgi:hypothetical protein
MRFKDGWGIARLRARRSIQPWHRTGSRIFGGTGPDASKGLSAAEIAKALGIGRASVPRHARLLQRSRDVGWRRSGQQEMKHPQCDEEKNNRCADCVVSIPRAPSSALASCRPYRCLHWRFDGFEMGLLWRILYRHQIGSWRLRPGRLARAQWGGLFGHVIPLHLRRLRLSGLGGFAACARTLPLA